MALPPQLKTLRSTTSLNVFLMTVPDHLTLTMRAASFPPVNRPSRLTARVGFEYQQIGGGESRDFHRLFCYRRHRQFQRVFSVGRPFIA
jgi:hypothetical protein